MSKRIIGREEEVRVLDDLLNSEDAEFLAVYGRRRVGKTHLIREYFQDVPCVFFEVTGLKDGSLKDQLALFMKAFVNTFIPGYRIQTPKNWMDAFEQISVAIENTPVNKRIVLFFDELPWLATKRSKLIQALDHYWNTRWSKRKKCLFIGCGSAAYWMIDNLINAKGGLHNRVTCELNVAPFTLAQTRDFLLSRDIKLPHQQILQIVMAVGGIPHYLKRIRRGWSFARNVNELCFKQGGFLADEFDKLFVSLFGSLSIYTDLIRLIAKYPYGLSREELLQEFKNSTSGGRLSKRLAELEKAGFITSFVPFGYAKKGLFYKVIDEYVLFYLTWIEPFKAKFKIMPTQTKYWEIQSNTQQYKIWCGYAFESICLKHINQILKKLDIEHLTLGLGPWRFVPNKQSGIDGAQVDLMVERSDGCINLCDMKHCAKPFVIDKRYANILKRKIDVFKKSTQTKSTILCTFITVNGIKDNQYARELVDAEIIVDDLFA